MNSITVGSDGNLWFTQTDRDKVDRMTLSGVFTEFDIPSGAAPTGITAGPDGNLWFGEGKSAIGRLTPSGTYTEFQLPTASAYPWSITSGPDGKLWFVEAAVGAIGTITVSGMVVERPVPMGGNVEGITRGADGNLWFLETGRQAPQVGRITPSGTISEFAIPTEYGGPSRICLGSDGNVWFTERGKVGRVTPAGVITEFTADGAGILGDIALGPDGNVWFAAGNGNNPGLGRVSPSGVVTVFPLTAVASGVTSGPDGNIWFTEQGLGTPTNIARFLIP